MSCGPLEIVVRSEDGALRHLIDQTLALYDVSWTMGRLRRVRVDVAVAPISVRPAAGSYIEAARMHVDAAPDGLRATTDNGASLVGEFFAESERWQMTVDPDLIRAQAWFDVEDLLTLILTTGWRRAGWVPLHAGGLVSPPSDTTLGSGVLVCAASGGGKTTFTVALVRRGWRSLGDDKLLLRASGGQSLVASVKQMLNIDPAAGAWFPELAGIADLPEYSTWTPKRRVSLGNIWSHAPAMTMQPTHLVVVSRMEGRGGIDVTPLSSDEAMSALLHQTVVPSEPSVARPIVAAVARLGEGIRGFRFRLFEDAFTRPNALEEATRVLT